MTLVEFTDEEYLIRVHTSPAGIEADAWNDLLGIQSSPTPFLRHEYLLALHESGSAIPATGWTPCFVTLHQGSLLQGACALYEKTHSHGEYVFDWAWADAYQRHGLAYYPKLLGAVPFTPVPGTRLLARSPVWRERLLTALSALAGQGAYSSAHVLFVDGQDRETFERAGWLMREGVQFHWTQDNLQPQRDFGELLARLQRDKRKKIQQERRRVAEQGLTFTVHQGAEIDDSLWGFFHRCYTLTYQAHRSRPYLTREFFSRMAHSMPENWLMFVAHQEGERVATSLVAIDPANRVAWGRYWGCLAPISCLHFEACYYQPLSWCLQHGYLRFEGGAQGEHKMNRGLLPVRTSSAHWLRDQRFAAAVADYLAAEGQGMDQYIDELRDRSPFKKA